MRVVRSSSCRRFVLWCRRVHHVSRLEFVQNEHAACVVLQESVDDSLRVLLASAFRTTITATDLSTVLTAATKKAAVRWHRTRVAPSLAQFTTLYAQQSSISHMIPAVSSQNVPLSKRPTVKTSHTQNVPSQNVPFLKQNVPLGQNVPSQNVPMLMN